MQRRIVAALIVETEVGPLGEDVVESSGSFSLTKGRWRLQMRFAPQTTLPAVPAGLGREWLPAAIGWRLVNNAG